MLVGDDVCSTVQEHKSLQQVAFYGSRSSQLLLNMRSKYLLHITIDSTKNSNVPNFSSTTKV